MLSEFLGADIREDPRVLTWAFCRGAAWLANARNGVTGRFGCGTNRQSVDAWRATRRSRRGPGDVGRPAEETDDRANAFLLTAFPQLARSPLALAALEAVFGLDDGEAISSRFAPASLWEVEPHVARRRRANARKRAAARLRRAAALLEPN